MYFFDVLIVIIKVRPPKAVPNIENVVVEQLAPEEQYAGPANTGDQVNDDMELDNDDDDNIIEDDCANTLINDTFNVRMDDDQVHHEIDDFDDVHDLPILEKAHEPFYEGSYITLLSVVLLVMNLKVINGFSNTSITQMLRYVTCFIDRIYMMIMINFIFVAIIFLLLVQQKN